MACKVRSRLGGSSFGSSQFASCVWWCLTTWFWTAMVGKSPIFCSESIRKWGLEKWWKLQGLRPGPRPTKIGPNRWGLNKKHRTRDHQNIGEEFFHFLGDLVVFFLSQPIVCKNIWGEIRFGKAEVKNTSRSPKFFGGFICSKIFEDITHIWDHDPQWSPMANIWVPKISNNRFFFRLHPGVVVDVKLKIGEDLGSSMRIKIFEDMMEMTRLGPSEKWRIDHFTSCKPAIIADVFTYPQCLVSSHALRPHVKLLGWSWMYFPLDLG